MATGVPVYPTTLDTDNSVGPTSGIVAGSTSLAATGAGQGDQLGITKNLINQVITLETVAGITSSNVITTLEFRIRKFPFKTWVAALDGSGSASLPATISLRNSRPVLAFDDSTTETTLLFGVFPPGATLGSGVIARLAWMSATAVTGNVMWSVSFERLVTDQDVDSFGTAVTATVACAATSGIDVSTPITVATLDGSVPGDAFCLRIQRIGGNVADTMVGDAQLQFVSIESAI